jgi:hypothetical protein
MGAVRADIDAANRPPISPLLPFIRIGSSYGRAPVTGLHPASNGDSLVSAANGAGIVLEGRITAYNASPAWRRAIETLTRQPDGPITVDASQLEYVDDVGIAYCGRYGDWGYMWTDESFISGERAAERALAG